MLGPGAMDTLLHLTQGLTVRLLNSVKEAISSLDEAPGIQQFWGYKKTQGESRILQVLPITLPQLAMTAPLSLTSHLKTSPHHG